jgi:multiple sugar transport system substrate-binding protein
MAGLARTGRGGRRSRRVAATGGALTIALLAAACGQGGDTGEASGDDGGEATAAGDEQVTLRFDWWGSDTRHAYTQEIIDIYEADNPNITIEPSFTGFAEYWDRLATGIAAGEGPDVYQHETRYIREYADRGSLLDLSPYVGDIIETDDLDDAVMETGVIDDALYAIPIGINAHGIIADPQVFQEAGVEMPDDETWTYPDAIDLAVEITNATPPGTYGWQMTTAIDTSFEIFARQRGEALFDEDGELGFERDTLVEWWGYQQAFIDEGGSPPASQAVELEAADLDGSLFSTGQGAMMSAWSNQLLTLNTVSGRDLEMLRMPGESAAEQAGMYFKPSQFWAASETTEHPEEAAAFINFLLNDPRVWDIMLSERGLPVNVAERERILSKLSPADQKAAAFLEEIEPDIAPPPPLPPMGASEVQGILQLLNQEVMFGQRTVEDAADAFMQQVEAATS